MHQEIEIELKNLLTAAEFAAVRAAFRLDDGAFFRQENHYFDTPSFALKERAAALRIRAKEGRLTLTLKQTRADGTILEIHEPLSLSEAEALLAGIAAPRGAIADLLAELGINPHEVRCFGSLVTDRAEWPHEGGTLCLDHNCYLQSEDYELEYEVDHVEAGEKRFLRLLEALGIPRRPAPNKIARFYARMKEMEERR
ncbi:CYTH domain-containing protein [Geobacillus sp. G4]|uniref:CYTH domain-containing protein n=5 Tax=Geobacillus TaxID=129337 RepID=A0A1V9CHC1_9BACL|nr:MULTISPECIES: CYTH domain-containing protein [Geobacillus]ADI27666.1 adenylate cyclase [Geobacillus sp. C56-T3]ADU93236.1 adenylate cyclase [Geobacillus sp. Y412MC52]AEV18303.1 Adenylate cyclase [Geobacillus thermoleovorans CCB_US3_UF5]AGE21311.1 CYTH domain protein [Geobacillus sp. GHH01]AMV10115.1 adenylate cyclase [Geobacillus thermoleovorans]